MTADRLPRGGRRPWPIHTLLRLGTRMSQDTMKDPIGPLHHRGPGETPQGEARHDEMSGGKETNQRTGGVITRRALAITPEADHATATGGVIGITTTGIDTTREEVPVPMTGTGGGPHEGPLHHLADQVRG
jgi:hypothetical protein